MDAEPKMFAHWSLLMTRGVALEELEKVRRSAHGTAAAGQERGSRALSGCAGSRRLKENLNTAQRQRILQLARRSAASRQLVGAVALELAMPFIHSGDGTRGTSTVVSRRAGRAPAEAGRLRTLLGVVAHGLRIFHERKHDDVLRVDPDVCAEALDALGRNAPPCSVCRGVRGGGGSAHASPRGSSSSPRGVPA